MIRCATPSSINVLADRRLRRAARDCRAEAIAPEAMRQHDDRRRALLGVRIGEEAAGGGETRSRRKTDGVTWCRAAAARRRAPAVFTLTV